VSGTPLARPSAWRLWWSFTWRQAAVMVLSTVALGAFLGVLNWLGLPTAYSVASVPYFTLLILIYSGYEAFRRLLIVYDIRLHGGPSDEQIHRHRR
jgi:hypothetical protein